MERIPNREIGYLDQRPFKEYLRDIKKLKESTIESYDTTVYYFFCFRMENTIDFDPSTAAEDTVVNDVKKYLDYLVKTKKYSISTHNKQLTALRTFFMYLYSQRIIRTYPAFDIKNLRKPNKADSLEDQDQMFDAWIDNMSVYLLNEDVSLFARVILLFISKGYGISKQIEKGFYKRIKHMNFAEYEKEVLNLYLESIKPLQTHFKTDEIFLKTRRQTNQDNNEPFMMGRRQLYNALNEAQDIWGFQVNPVTLVKQVRMRYIRDNPDMNEFELMDALEIKHHTVTQLIKEVKLVYSTE